jgi:hypothetical protein
MSFTPIRMQIDGRNVLVGSATDREHLLSHGYTIVPEPADEPKPVPEPQIRAPRVAVSDADVKPDTKTK